MKNAKKLLAMVLLLTALAGVLCSCSDSSSSSSRKPGQCIWCDGYGYSSYYDTDGKLRTKTCSHCHGSGLW